MAEALCWLNLLVGEAVITDKPHFEFFKADLTVVYPKSSINDSDTTSIKSQADGVDSNGNVKSSLQSPILKYIFFVALAKWSPREQDLHTNRKYLSCT